MDEIQSILEDCFKQISNKIQNYNSLSLGSITKHKNQSDDQIKKLDLLADQLLTHNLLKCSQIRNIASEESDSIISTHHKNAPYLICFDPLDGSSNIDINITVGTIFAVYKYNNNKHKIWVKTGKCI